MGMRIEEIGKLYLPPAGVGEGEKKAALMPGDSAGDRDSYIPSAGGHDVLCSTGNYDENGQIDDDFSINIGGGDEAVSQVVEYNREYAQQLMKTVGKPEESSSDMNRRQ